MLRWLCRGDDDTGFSTGYLRILLDRVTVPSNSQLESMRIRCSGSHCGFRTLVLACPISLTSAWYVDIL